MILSVIIPTYMRPELLRFCLSSWVSQKIPFSYEIVIVNDGLEGEVTNICKEFSNKLPIKYIFSGSRNTPYNMIWRCASCAINIGVKQSSGDHILICSSEMYILKDYVVKLMVAAIKEKEKRIVITYGLDDEKGFFLNSLKNNRYTGGGVDEYFYKLIGNCTSLDTKFPFFMCLNKGMFSYIGGYDEDFIGYAYDDADFMDRYIAMGGVFYILPEVVIHLYHSRLDYNNPEIGKKLKYNENLWLSKKGQFIRNIGREWGVLK